MVMRPVIAVLMVVATLAAAPARGAPVDTTGYKPLWCAAMLNLAADDYRGNLRYRDHVKKTATYEFGAELMTTLGRRILAESGATPEQVAALEGEANAAARAQLRERSEPAAFTWMSCWLDVEV